MTVNGNPRQKTMTRGEIAAALRGVASELNTEIRGLDMGDRLRSKLKNIYHRVADTITRTEMGVDHKSVAISEAGRVFHQWVTSAMLEAGFSDEDQAVVIGALQEAEADLLGGES